MMEETVMMAMMMTTMMEEENNKNNNPTGSLPTKRISLVKITVLSISKNKDLIESFIEEDVLNRHDLSVIEKYSNPIGSEERRIVQTISKCVLYSISRLAYKT